MSTLEFKKEPEILAVLDALRERLGPESFQVVDHWPEDSNAIGVAAPADGGILAYISAYADSDKPYFVSLEFPPAGEWHDHPYTPGEDRNDCYLDDLVQVVGQHLRAAMPLPNISLQADREG